MRSSIGPTRSNHGPATDTELEEPPPVIHNTSESDTDTELEDPALASLAADAEVTQTDRRRCNSNGGPVVPLTRSRANKIKRLRETTLSGHVVQAGEASPPRPQRPCLICPRFCAVLSCWLTRRTLSGAISYARYASVPLIPVEIGGENSCVTRVLECLKESNCRVSCEDLFAGKEGVASQLRSTRFYVAVSGDGRDVCFSKSTIFVSVMMMA